MEAWAIVGNVSPALSRTPSHLSRAIIRETKRSAREDRALLVGTQNSSAMVETKQGGHVIPSRCPTSEQNKDTKALYLCDTRTPSWWLH